MSGSARRLSGSSHSRIGQSSPDRTVSTHRDDDEPNHSGRCSSWECTTEAPFELPLALDPGSQLPAMESEQPVRAHRLEAVTASYGESKVATLASFAAPAVDGCMPVESRRKIHVGL